MSTFRPEGWPNLSCLGGVVTVKNLDEYFGVSTVPTHVGEVIKDRDLNWKGKGNRLQ